MEKNVETGIAVREEFGAVDTRRYGETSAIAVAEQAKAAVQARYVMAMQRPRNWDDVRLRLLKECQRPGFAEVAIYHKPVGKGVEGPSIRFAEAALRCMTNALPETIVVYDDAEKRIVRVSVTDLEANVTYSKDVVVEKTVERSQVKAGQEVLRARQNSQGKTTYIVAATEEDLLNKQNAIESKALRVLALRHLPGDIQDECIRAIYATRAKQDAQDPDAAKKKLLDAFATINVMPSDLEKYLGHDTGAASPAELNELRGVFAAVRDGETSWPAALEHKLSLRGDGDKKPASTLEKRAAAMAQKAREQECEREPGSEG